MITSLPGATPMRPGAAVSFVHPELELWHKKKFILNVLKDLN